MSMTQVLPSHHWTEFESLKYSQSNSVLLIDEQKADTIPEFVKHVANVELREDDGTREQALEAFRDWISKNTDVKNIHTGNFLSLQNRNTVCFAV